MLPKEARYDELMRLPKGEDFGAALVAAMNAIEREFEPLLNQLPKDYGEFEPSVLENLLRLILDHVFSTLPDPPFTDIDKQAAADRLFQHVWHLSASGGLAAISVS